jgi:hypothetical protein
MANKIILKKSSVSGKVPATGDLEFGELALNYADGKLYYKTNAGVIDYIATGGSGTAPENANIGASFLSRTYTGDDTTTSFSVTNGVTVDSIIVTENGVIQTPGVDYTVSGSALIFTVAPEQDVLIQVRELFTGPALESLAVSSFSETGDGTTDTFTLPNTPANIAHTIVNIDGVVQVRGVAYTLTGSDIVFAEPVPDGQHIDITIFEIVTSAITDLIVSGESNLGDISNVTIAGGTAGQVITTDGAGNLSFTTVEGGGANLEDSTTDDLDEGLANLYFTIPRARESISVAGSLNYNSSTGVISYNQPTGLSAFINDAGYLQNYTETDPIFTTSAAYSITTVNINNWDAAYNWGNHALAGYLTTETDPVFVASAAYNISSTDISNWNAAHGWGDHALAGYLTTETDPVFVASAAYQINQGLINNWNDTYTWGNHASAGYATETYVNTAISNLVDSAPAALDTLNELAAALGDDENFATTVATSIGTKLSTADFTSTADTWLGTKSTSDLTEGSNLYYTTDRVNSAIDTRVTKSYVEALGIETVTSILDLGITDGTAGQVLSTNGSGTFTFVTPDTGANVTVSATAPVSPAEGDIWLNSETLDLFMYIVDGDDELWIQVNGTPAASSIGDLSDVDITTTAPVDGDALIWNATESKFVPGASFSSTGVNNAIDTRVNKSFVDALNVDADTLDGLDSTAFATSVQGLLADSAIQPGDDISELTNDAGYLTTETDPVFVASVAYNITSTDTTNWNTSYSWGNHASAGYATETYVNTAISNLVDSAPEALNTLNELAAALGDDENFATTVATSIGTKLSTADFSSTADTWLGTKSTTNVAEGTNLYYTDTRANAAIDARVVKTFVDALNVDADTLDGLDSTAFATAAQGLLADSAVQPGDNISALTNDAGFITGVSSINDIGDVVVTTPSNGQVLSYNGTNWVNAAPTGGGGGGASVTTSDTAPSTPAAGDLWFDTSSLTLYVYYTDTDSSQWVQVSDGESPVTYANAIANFNTRTYTGDGSTTEYEVSAGLYTSGVIVTENGIVQVPESDYSISGTTLTFTNAPASGMVVQIREIVFSNVWTATSTSLAISKGQKLFVDCSAGPVTVTLPAAAAMGDEVTIVDAMGTAGINNITVARNGHNIVGNSTDLTIDINNAAITLAYYNVNRGWLIVSK